MNNLVFLEPNKLDEEPFTTSDVIAKNAMVSYRSVQRMIEKHETDITEFGRVRFQITPLETNGGLQSKKIYHLNEQQATLLITYLKNTAPVRQFKKNLVREFYLMRAELTQRQILREVGKPIRRTLTDAIRDSGENQRMHGHAYSTYTDLAYRLATGKNAGRLRKERGAHPRATATDFLTAAEMEQYNLAESRLAILVDMRLSYEEIKQLTVMRLLKAS